ncbi:MAG: 6-hydroxymethylpterin diphosphokinase MptE-like protein [Lachnospiraceae bacterium]|nr:6-hydroxymethylpterin diphosphokinase MptE-like protein [Lachnospiraceae bacterium]
MKNLYTVSQVLNKLINYTETSIENIRLQHYWKTAQSIRSLSSCLTDFFSISTEIFDKTTQSNLLSYLQEILDAQSLPDYVLMGDLLEINLLPSFYEMQAILLSNMAFPQNDYFDANIKLLSQEKYPEAVSLYTLLMQWNQAICNTSSSESEYFYNNYKIEPTNSGCLTLKKKNGDSFFYFHSNQNPQKEGYFFANSYTHDNMLNYSVIGFGLGYHIIGLLQKDTRYHISILEPDLNILGAAFKYMDLTYLLSSGRTKIIYTPDLCELDHYVLPNESELLIHYPTLVTLKEGPIKESLKRYFINLSTIYEQKQLLNENFYYNIVQDDYSIDSIKEHFKNKDIIYIGGGPSAETKLAYIKNYIKIHPKTLTICAGTVYRKLLASDFVPDFVIISDAQMSLSRQLENIPENTTRLIYLATASHKAVKAFKGTKYIAFQSGFESSEKIANEKNYTLFSTGGSVSTLAIDLVIRYGCKKLITIGLDLSFPQNKTHGFSLSEDIAPNTFPLTATDLHGNPVRTSQLLNIYRKWIEERIQKESSIEFINLTEGAYIEGMKNLDCF